MDALPGLVVAAVSALGLFLLMWWADWLHDVKGRWEVNAVHVAFLVLAAVGGFVSGAVYGIAAGLAVVVAGVNVPVAVLFAWGLAGGDGEPNSPVAGLLGLVVLFCGVTAFAVAVATAGEAGRRELLLVATPALAVLAAVPFVPGEDRRQFGLAGLGVFAIPPVLLALA